MWGAGWARWGRGWCWYRKGIWSEEMSFEDVEVFVQECGVCSKGFNRPQLRYGTRHLFTSGNRQCIGGNRQFVLSHVFSSYH